jgi:tRNA-2-methylthio-N6-dimethylallyladenosine synthase
MITECRSKLTEIPNNAKPLGVWIQTLGCQMNEHDSEIILGMLQKMGYREVDSKEEADLIIFNTCCVRENPERKIYGQVHNLRALKKEKPDLIIAICGCMPQQNQEAQRMAEELEHVDLIFGTHNLYRLPELLNKVIQTGERMIELWDEHQSIVEDLPVKRAGKVSAYVTIIYGCDEFCTYCVVPHVRGRQRSRRPENILSEVRSLAVEGYKEVTLLGQNVNAYGQDLDGNYDFAGLLKEVSRIQGIERIRYTSPHPKYFTEDVIKVIKESPNITRHIHLPAQAGSDRVLRRMGRGYTKSQYLALVDSLRRNIPEIAISTDLIVGFPGESDEDFQETLDLVRQAEFDSAFMFIYSPRYGTPATRLKDQIPEIQKHQRIDRLIQLQNQCSLKKNLYWVGHQVEVLVEGESKKNPQVLSGRTSQNKVVVFTGPKDLAGSIVKVKITEAQTWNLIGELVG